MVIPPPITDPEPEPDIRSHHNGYTTQLPQHEQLGAAPNSNTSAEGNRTEASRDHDFAFQHMTGLRASPPIAPTPAHASSPRVILPAANQAPTISTLSDHDGPDDDDEQPVKLTYWQGFKVSHRVIVLPGLLV